jgi:hypothetical protein
MTFFMLDVEKYILSFLFFVFPLTKDSISECKTGFMRLNLCDLYLFYNLPVQTHTLLAIVTVEAHVFLFCFVSE